MYQIVILKLLNQKLFVFVGSSDVKINFDQNIQNLNEYLFF